MTAAVVVPDRLMRSSSPRQGCNLRPFLASASRLPAELASRVLSIPTIHVDGIGLRTRSRDCSSKFKRAWVTQCVRPSHQC
jgi:hypothetical protein